MLISNILTRDSSTSLNSLLDESFPSGPSGLALALLRSGCVTYSAAVDACSDNLLCFSCTDGSGHGMLSACVVLSAAMFVCRKLRMSSSFDSGSSCNTTNTTLRIFHEHLAVAIRTPCRREGWRYRAISAKREGHEPHAELDVMPPCRRLRRYTKTPSKLHRPRALIPAEEWLKQE